MATDGIKVITLDIADGADLNVDVTDAATVRAAAEQACPSTS
ncbi:hypothetical protein AB0C12_12915 [Actinoplanes sp. NPDC048967]